MHFSVHLFLILYTFGSILGNSSHCHAISFSPMPFSRDYYHSFRRNDLILLFLNEPGDSAADA